MLFNGEPAEPDRIVAPAFDGDDAKTWRSAFLAATPEVGEEMRRQALGKHLERATVLRDTCAERLRVPYPVGMIATTRWADQYGALLLWWQTRLRQGYTPEAVATVLSLTCHPSLLAHITFPPLRAGGGDEHDERAPVLAVPDD